jgi:hypothetical protein
VEDDHPLKPGDELCLFPPVSGGSQGVAVRAAAAGEASP